MCCADCTQHISPNRGVIPNNKPYLCGEEIGLLQQMFACNALESGLKYTQEAQQWFEHRLGHDCKRFLLTTSGTSALEMAALLANIAGPEDEVIVPSFTFVSTASAFVMRGAKIVFVDIRMDTLNIDETKIEAAITPHTKAICGMWLWLHTFILSDHRVFD